MRKIFLSLLFLLFSTVAFAQKNTISISGKMLDGEDHLPLPYASIMLYSLPDSTFLRGTVSDDDGNFSISSDIIPGDYFLRMSFLGYESIDKKFNVKSEDIHIGRVLLRMDAVLLGEAVVTAEAIPVIVREDTTIFSASAFNVADGAALEELVKRLPGAEIKDDGKVYVNGKEVKRIMVDGKEFFTDDPQIALKNLPANMVEKVKTYDRKSDNARLTGMDDDEEETVLDLTVKKGMKQGWFGNVLAGGGSKLNGTNDNTRYEAGGMINRFQENSNLSVIASSNNTNNQGFSEFGDSGFGVRGGGNSGRGITSSSVLGATFAQNYNKVELGGNVQYGHSDNDAKTMRATTTTLRDSLSSYRADSSNSRRISDNIGVNFRLEWKPDSMSTITFRPNLTYSRFESSSDGSSHTRNNERKPINYNKSITSADGNNIALGGNLQYTRKLNKKGRNFSLSARMNYTNNESDNYTDSRKHFYNESEEMDSLLWTNQYADKGRNSLTYRLQGSYTEPLSTNYRLQFKYTFEQRNSTSSAFVFDEAEREIYIDSLSNEAKNLYTMHQIETNLQGNHSKFNYNVGFSLQPQLSRSEITIGRTDTLKQKVLNFSPNLRLRYRFSKQEMIMVRYRGQSSAPDAEYLQDIIDISDPLDMQYGNPDLKPSYRSTVTLRYSKFVSESQRSYTVNGNFSNTMNAITRRVDYDTITGGKVSHIDNVNGNWNADAFFTFSSPLYRKISLSSSSNASYGDDVSFTSVNRGESEKNTTHTLGLRERLSIIFRNELLDVTLNGSINYMLVRNSIRTNSNQETCDYELGGNANINLPWNMLFSTDLNWRIFRGYSEGFDEDNVIWNAQISKNFLKNNAATIRFKVYDILQQQNSLTRNTMGTSIIDTESNTLGSYFMVHFVYRINTLGKQQSGKSSSKERGLNRPQRQNSGGRGY